MQIAETPGAGQRLRQALRGQVQQTFETPLEQLDTFAATVLGAHAPVESGSVSLQQIVFTPRQLEALLTEHRLTAPPGEDWTITASGVDETAALLEAVWSDWVDFYFTPTPTRYHIFADHDEFTTIFAATSSDLAKVTMALRRVGFSPVHGYQRE
jgi:hypothetical protein